VRVSEEAIGDIEKICSRFGLDLVESLEAILDDGGADLSDWAELLDWLAEQAGQRALYQVVSVVMEGDVALEGGRPVYQSCGAIEPAARREQAAERAMVSRAIYLAGEIPRMQARYGELYPEEVEEVDGLRERLLADVSLVTKELTHRLEELFEMVHPWARLFRGDKDARKRWDEAKVRFQEEAKRGRAMRSEMMLLMDGELAPAELSDPAGMKAKLQEQLDIYEARERELSYELKEATGRCLPLRKLLEAFE